MTDRELLDEMVGAAGQLGAEVRIERFDPPAQEAGGACRLRGRRLILLDAGAPLRQQVLALATALASLGADRVYVTPSARELIEAAGG